MSKSVLVMNTPFSCGECRFCDTRLERPCCNLTGNGGTGRTVITEDIQKKRSEWCPLKEVPEMDGLMASTTVKDCMNPVAYARGWNDFMKALENGGVKA